jgi:hypothetical protein
MKRFGEKWKPILIVIGLALALLILWFVPKWQVRGYHGNLDASAISKLTPQELIQLQQNLITAENNARLTIAQIIGGFGLLLGLYATFKNVKIAQDNHRVALENLRVTEEGKLTERFSKAVELLGNTNLDVKLGGIYALERIARDSLKDHWTVMEILTAFVREQSVRWYKSSQRWITDDFQNISYLDPVQPEINISVDVQAALTVIGRRKWVDQERRKTIELSGSFLAGAMLFDANLNSSNLTAINLTDATIYDSNLNNTVLIKAILVGTNFGYTKLDEAYLDEADLTGAELIGVDLSTTTGLTWEQISKANIDETTKLPPELEIRRKAEDEKKVENNERIDRVLRRLFSEEGEEEKEQIEHPTNPSNHL